MLHEVLTLAFDDQPTDHSGDSVTPLTSAGSPYRYALVGYLGRPETTYASNADALLSVIIPGYEPLDLTNDDLDQTPEDPTDQEYRDRYIAQATLRTQYAYGVAFDNAAQALINDTLTETELGWLQRSLEYEPPLTIEELPEWTAQVPMILLAAYYRRAGLAAPAGNIVWLDGYPPETLIAGLAKAGVIRLREHTSARHLADTEIRLGELPPAELLSNLHAQLEMTAANLDRPEAEDHHRETLRILTRRLHDWPGLPSHDTNGKLRTRLEHILTSPDEPTAAAAKELSKKVGKILTAIISPDPDEPDTPAHHQGRQDGDDGR